MVGKIKVINTRKNVITINLSSFNGKVIPLSQNGFAYLTEDEFSYLINTSKVFNLGILKVDAGQQVPEDIEVPVSPNALTDDDIVKMLKLTQKSFAIELNKITDIQIAKRIFEIAKELDKSIKIIEMIEAKIEELRL